MTQMELIDRLCAVTTALADIVRQQESVIAQHRMLDTESGEKIAAKREAAYAELDVLELNLRPFAPFTCGKEERSDA